MTCLTEKDKRLSELDHELTALNTKKIELTTRKQDVSGDYLTYGIVFLFFVLSMNLILLYERAELSTYKIFLQISSKLVSLSTFSWHTCVCKLF